VDLADPSDPDAMLRRGSDDPRTGRLRASVHSRGPSADRASPRRTPARSGRGNAPGRSHARPETSRSEATRDADPGERSPRRTERRSSMSI
jgi:hypothetical protein